MNAPESSVFQVLFQAAWKEYENRTGTNFDQHPLIHQLQTCHSFESLISLLQGQAQTFDEFRSGEKVGAHEGGNYNDLVNLFESIAIFLRRLEIYIKIPPTAAMTEIVVKILVELLTTLALAAKQMNQKAVGRIEIETVLERLDRLTQDEARTTAAQTFQVVYGLVQNMTVVMDDFKASTDNVREALSEHFQEAIQTWLTPPDPWENHGTALKAHRNGTSEWFIQGNTFAEWKSFKSLLWIHGTLGCGKTILCSAIIEDIYSMCKAKLASLAFFYFDRDDNKKDLRSLLSSLIFQLYDQSDSYFNILSAFYSAHRCGSQYPSDTALAQCLKDMLRLPGQAPIYVILDGIDECPKRLTVFPLVKMSDVRRGACGFTSSKSPHLCQQSTRRRHHGCHCAFSTSFHFSPQRGRTKEELIQFVRSVVDSKPGMRNWAAEDKELVIDLLLQKADGMFRWVICQLDVLPNCSRRIQRILDEVLASLGTVYERTLEEIPDTQWECARLLLECLLVSFRPLLVEELAEFLAFDFGAPIPKLQTGWRPTDPEDDLPSMCSVLCGGLLTTPGIAHTTTTTGPPRDTGRGLWRLYWDM
ncbi:hypothetical protein BGW80DRAFT_1255032 [Lactifluus volemus]|nr:hypothetical protein BGW80DRAFT_1255032 [Lactifluus volemus]